MEKIKKSINKLHEEKLYRPVAITIITKDDKYLMVQSAKGSKPWGLPQGGIEHNEEPIDAMFREINEELNIKKEELKIIEAFFYYNEEDAPKDRKDKRGFLKGKAYFFSFCSYHGNNKITLQEEEIYNYKWVDLNDFMSLLKTSRKEKQNMILIALNKLGINKQ